MEMDRAEEGVLLLLTGGGLIRRCWSMPRLTRVSLDPLTRCLHLRGIPHRAKGSISATGVEPVTNGNQRRTTIHRSTD